MRSPAEPKSSTLINIVRGDTPRFSDVWQAKDLREAVFVCVAGKGVTGAFLGCVAGKGLTGNCVFEHRGVNATDRINQGATQIFLKTKELPKKQFVRL